MDDFDSTPHAGAEACVHDRVEVDSKCRRTTPPTYFDGPAYPLSQRRERVIISPKCWEFLPHDEGIEANVLDVLDVQGEPIDAVTWIDKRPYIWASRRRCAVFLGESEVERATLMDIPLLLLDTPAAWAEHHATGKYWPCAVVIDWTARQELFVTLTSLKVRASPSVKAKLRKAMRELVAHYSANVELADTPPRPPERT
jgi:hypothetical protein